ncbi:unnamed protein product, partial [Iphiclides podalirius]
MDLVMKTGDGTGYGVAVGGGSHPEVAWAYDVSSDAPPSPPPPPPRSFNLTLARLHRSSPRNAEDARVYVRT